jgi:hypothetical protein
MAAVQLTFDFDVSDIENTARDNLLISRHEHPIPRNTGQSTAAARHISFPRKTK